MFIGNFGCGMGMCPPMGFGVMPMNVPAYTRYTMMGNPYLCGCGGLAGGILGANLGGLS